MALTVGGGRWECEKVEKSTQKRERQIVASEVSDVEINERKICDVSVSHSGAEEDSCLLRC
jgi:hypothetical protein